MMHGELAKAIDNYTKAFNAHVKKQSDLERSEVRDKLNMKYQDICRAVDVLVRDVKAGRFDVQEDES